MQGSNFGSSLACPKHGLGFRDDSQNSASGVSGVLAMRACVAANS